MSLRLSLRRLSASAALLVAALPAAAGLLFREVEIGGAAATVREVRAVSAQGEECRIVLEESADPLVTAGSYILLTAHDAFLVDPSRAAVAPVAPTNLQPVTPPGDEGSAEPRVYEVSLDRALDEEGPAILGLPTRHYVYLLRYREGEPAGGGPEVGAVVHRERHEFWATPWPEPAEAQGAWREWRVAEDAGAAAGRRELREAVEQLYDHGLFLRQRVERDGPDAPANVLSREITSLEVRSIPEEVFRRPEGYTQYEFLTPSPGPATEGPGGAGTPRGDTD